MRVAPRSAPPPPTWTATTTCSRSGSAERAGPPPTAAAWTREVTRADLAAAEGRARSTTEDADAVPARASSAEVLRNRDIATMSRREREELGAQFAALRARPPRRRAHRHSEARRGSVDARRTLRSTLRRMGEPGEVSRRRRGSRPRRLVLLVDVSGSMSAYADALLRLAHAYCASGAPTEVFTLGTRLTHITRQLHQRDPERALVAAGGVIPDWSGGTRLARGRPAVPRPVGSPRRGAWCRRRRVQ